MFLLLLFKLDQTYNNVQFLKNCVYKVPTAQGFANRWLSRGAVKVDPDSFKGELSYNELCPKEIIEDKGVSQEEIDALTDDSIEEVVEEEAIDLDIDSIDEVPEEGVVEEPVVEEPVAKEEKVVENKPKKVRKPRKK